MTPAAYARHRGVSKEAVSKAIREGRISTGRGGRIDPVAADLEWGRNTSPRPSSNGSPPSPAAAGLPVDLTEARTMHEYAKAQLAELELGERQGQLVALSDLRDTAFRATRSARDLLLSIPDRLAEVLLGATDAAEVRRLLRDEIARACDELADAEPPPDAPPPADA